MFSGVNYHLLKQVLIVVFTLSTVPYSVTPHSPTSSIKFPSSVNTEEVIQNGRKEYNTLIERKSNPKYGTCWADAIIKLEKSCNELDEYRQSWLSILFTNCFMKTLGSESWISPCDIVIDSSKHTVFSNSLIPQIKECTKSIMHTNILSTYSMFFVHTQSICFYLQSEQWQRHTENLVDHLVYNAKEVSGDLNSAVNKIRELEKLQNSSLQAQLSINEELIEAKTNLHKFQEQTKEQRDLIEKVIQHFELLREFLLREFSTSSAIVFYLFAILVVYFVTTPQRTIGVRLILYILLMCCFLIEKNAFDYFINIGHLVSFYFVSHADSIYSDYTTTIWCIRKTIIFLMCLIYLWRIVTYQDITQINYRLLNENTAMLRHIQQQLNNSDKRKCICIFSMKLLLSFFLLIVKYLSIDNATYSDESEQIDYSDDDEDSLCESDNEFISTDFDSDADNLDFKIPKFYNLRTNVTSHKVLTELPQEYRNETVNEFVENVKNIGKHENYYSSDEN